MATKKAASKSKKAPAKKTAAKKAAPARKPASKAAAKPVARPAAKKAARPTPTHAAAAARSASIHLHPVKPSNRRNAPTPAWLESAIANAQANPGVSLVCLIAAAIGIMLILN